MSTKDYGLTKDSRAVWHCDFYSSGTRFQRSTFTKDREAAEEYCRKLDTGAWREKKLGTAPQITWADGIVKWLDQKTREGNKDLVNDSDKARVLAPYLNPIWLHELTADICNRALDDLADEREWAVATRNRHSSFIKRVLNVLRERYGVASFKLKAGKERNRDTRWLTREQAAKLLGELTLHLRRMVEFSLLTGLRQSNVTGLTWDRVDLDRAIAWIPPTSSKSNKAIGVPLQPRAVELLREARACKKHGHAKVCFTYYKSAVQYPADTPWEEALVRAGIDNFRWHDLRHTWASWHVQGWWDAKGRPTPLDVLQKLGGWASIKMVQRYAHLAPDYTAAFAGNMPVVFVLPPLGDPAQVEGEQSEELEPAE